MTAAEHLAWHYANPFAHAAASGNAVGVTSNTVPWEILEAAGYTPVLLNPPPGPTPNADRFLESGVFEPRLRHIFEGFYTGSGPFLKRLVVARTSEQEHKLFLYLKEVERQEPDPRRPAVELLNLLAEPTHEARAYCIERMGEFARSIPNETLRASILNNNRARRALGQLLALRGPAPRISGIQALRLIGAYYFMNRAEFATLAECAASELTSLPPLDGPRILIKGAPLEHTELHQEVESQGAVVFAEDDWLGARALLPEIAIEGDLIANLCDAYRQAPSPRLHDGHAWFHSQLPFAGAIVFYLPPEDAVLGWDYPALRAAAEAAGKPYLLLRSNARAIPREDRETIAAFIAKLRDHHG